MVVRKAEGYTLLVLEIFIIILNTLAIIVIQRFKKKCNPDILILTLAVADLIKAFIPLNMTLVAYLGGIAMTEGSPKCIIFGWTAFTVNSSIMLVMTLMAIDRYVAICRPFKYKHILTKKRLIYAIIAAFVFSGVHSILPLVGVGRMRSYYNGSFCHFDFDSTVPASLGYSVFVLVLGISMLVVVIFCYTRAMFSIKGLIRRQRRMSAISRDIDGSDRKRQSMNHMFARLMIVMMIAFCISWVLFLIVVLQHVSGWFVIPSAAHFWSMRLAVINSLLNPIIGAAMCKPYRKGYMFILCKCLHCCGLCSSYKAENPWTRSRKFSAGSRNSYERDQNEPNQNDAIRSRVRNNSSFNSHHDSGIVPDSNDCTGSLRYDQDGVFNDAFDIDGGSGGGRFQTRPWLSRKRISFKDELDAQKVAEMSLIEEKAAEPLARIPDDTTDPDQHSTPPLPKITKGNRLTTQLVNNDTENTSREKQSTSLLTPPDGKDSRMTAVSSNGNQRRKYGISGIDQSSLEPYSLGRPPVNIHSLVTSNSDPTPKLDHTTEEQITHGENASLENTVSLMTKEQGATASYLPEGIIGDKSEQEKSFRELGELYLISPGESSFESVQITHFPVGTNSCTKTTTVKSPVLKNSQRSKSSCGFSPFTFRSGSFTERTQKMSLENQKTRSPSCANDCLVNKSDNTRQERPGDSFKRQLIHPATTQRAHAAEGLFDATSYKSGQVLASNFSPNLGRAKSFESMIDNTRSKLDSSAHGGLDLFQRHSSALKEGQLNVHCNWYSSEPDLTRTSPCRSPPGNSEPHSEPSKENMHNSYKRRASSPQVTSLSPSKIYRQLSELSQKELEREVFC